MSTENDPAEIAPEEKAFAVAVNGQAFDNSTLFPFSPARQRAAQAMGMKAPMFDAEDFAAMGAAKPYAGALRDTTIYLWLCSIRNASEQEDEDRAARKRGERPAPAWTVQRAARSPIEAYDEAEKWCDEKGVALGSPAFRSGYESLCEKMTAILESMFQIKGGESGGDEAGNG
jgi:hypothetical protein